MMRRSFVKPRFRLPQIRLGGPMWRVSEGCKIFLVQFRSPSLLVASGSGQIRTVRVF
jgi:hypothetical protein